MKNFLRFDNPLFVFVGKLVDVFVVHILWILCSIPIITFGASTTAMYYSLMKDVADEDTHYVKSFFRSFKQNLKQGIPLGILVAAAGLLLAFAIRYYIVMEGGLFAVLKWTSLAMGIVYILMLQYVFALQARFNNTIRGTIRNAILFAIKYFGWSIVMVLVVVIWYGAIIMMNLVPLFLLGYGVVVYINARILNKILAPYIEKEYEAEAAAAEAEEAARYESLSATDEEMAEWNTPLSTAAVLEKMAKENAEKETEDRGDKDE